MIEGGRKESVFSFKSLGPEKIQSIGKSWVWVRYLYPQTRKRFPRLLRATTCFLYLWLCFYFVNFFFFFTVFKKFYFWLLCAGLSLVVVSRGYSLLQCKAFSLWWLLWLWSTGSRHLGSSSCSMWAQQLRHRSLAALWHVESSQIRSCLYPCSLHWQVDACPLHPEGSPFLFLLL